MQENAVEIVARLFRRNGELGLVDKRLERRRLKPEDMREGTGGQFGEVRLWQALEPEAGPPGRHSHRIAVLFGPEHDLGALGKLAYDVVEQVSRHGRCATL